jgi:hypothetical protein
MNFPATFAKSTFVDSGVREGGLCNDSPRIYSPGGLSVQRQSLTIRALIDDGYRGR